jgi:putative CocE/NonD family hydrolase
MASVIGAMMTPGTLQHRPLSALAGIAGTDAQDWWRKWLEHEYRDGYWEAISPAADFSRFEVPMLHVGGWFDLFCNGTIRNFLGLVGIGKAAQHLLMGPWCHGGFERTIGEVDFGLFANPLLAGIPGRYAEFFDAHLKGQASSQPPVTYFLMGPNEWRTATSWPPAEARTAKFYLHSMGRANGAGGDGTMNVAAPSDEPADHFIYDPADPVPTNGGPIYHGLAGGTANLGGPRDQRQVEARNDVLCYTTDSLKAPMTVAGPVTLLLWATTDAPDTDWTAKLVDVATDGTALGVCDGILRATCRHGIGAPDAPVPGEPAYYRIEIGHTAHRFASLHRMRIEISSSNAPRFRPNPNTGESLVSTTAMRTASQTVHHDRHHPSFLTVSLIDEAVF